MGVFDFFKKKEERISFDELDSWLDRYVEGKDLEKKFNDFKKELEKKLEELKRFVRDLETAELLNDNIPEKELNIMTGNRENYVKKMLSFSNDIKFPENYNEVGYFASDLSEKINDLGEATQKGFFVLKHFFEDEVKKVAGTIKKMEDMVIEFMRDLDKENISLVDEIRIDLKNFRNDVKSIDEIKNEIGEQNKKIKGFEEKKKKHVAKLDELKESSEYKKLESFHKKKEEVSNRVESLKKELKLEFAGIERSLKKFVHSTPDERFVKHFLQDPVEELMGDSNLRISDIIEKLDEETKLTRSYLSDFRKNVADLKDSLKEVNKKLRNSVVSLNITEQEGFIRGADENVEEHSAFIEELKEKLANISPQYAENKIREKIHKLADVVFNDEY